MAKQFNDFTFRNKRISDLSTKYISVNFDTSDDKALGLERDMEKGESTRYRFEPNYFYDTWSNPLEFELHIIKDPCEYTSQTEMELSKSEIRELTSWFTSSHYPEWIQFVDEDGEMEEWKYKGWFSNVETFVAYGMVYGLKLHFKCTTSFAYTDKIAEKHSVTSYKNVLISNNSDCLDSYVYPVVKIHPNTNGEVFILNESDCTVLKNGKVSSSSTDDIANELLDIVEAYAKENDYDISYTGTGAYNIVMICNDTAAQFKLSDKWGNYKLCTIFCNINTMEYKIINNGFMYMKVYKDLDVIIDCEKMTIMDSIGRMVTYEKMNIADIGQLYWLRLLNGNNSILIYGNADFTFEHIEERKVGE